MTEPQTDPSLLPKTLWWLPGAFFLLCVLLGAATVFLTPETFELPERGSWVRGERTAQYERDLDASLPFRDLAITTWGVLEYTLFREGRPGVLIGEGDWLFTDEEFAVYPDEAARLSATLRDVEQVRAALAEHGADLVVALLPAKARVYEEQLGRYRLPDAVAARYETFRSALDARGVLAPDLLTPLVEAKGTAPVFLRTDTHWTPFGAQVVASALAEAVREELPEGSELFTAEYETRALPPEPFRGDLLAFVPLGPLEHLGPPPETLTPQVTEALEASGGGLFDAPEIPVALVGTSYSAGERWNFAGALREAFGADVLNVADEGQGPLPPMRAFLDSAALRETPPEVVVWELPERYVPIPNGPEGDALIDEAAAEGTVPNPLPETP